MNDHKVSVLFARKDSIYKSIPGCDVWDEDRDALNWPGGLPVVAHPPCRLWGRLRGLSTAPESEKFLALAAVSFVRLYGGVLEHPEASTLWHSAGLPLPGARLDQYGGYTIKLDQFDFGHRARKASWVYVVGVDRSKIVMPDVRTDSPTHVITSSKFGCLPAVGRDERDRSPLDFALWLVRVAVMADRCHRSRSVELVVPG